MKKLSILSMGLALALIGATAPASAAPNAMGGLSKAKPAVEKVHYRKWRHHHRRYYRSSPGISLYIGPSHRNWRHRHWRRHRD
jgi:hypothetical protein